MKRIATAVAVGLGLTLAAAPADAQLINFPVNAVPSSFGTPSSFIAASMGRGLNDESGKQNAFGLFVGRTGMAERVNIAAGVGMITYDPDSKYTFGGSLGVDVLDPAATTQVSVQGGIGYLSIADGFSTMNFPIGVAIKTMVASESGNIGLWAMPRLNIARSKVSIAGAGDLTDTSTDLGVSGGASFTSSGGFGVHASLDVLAADASAMVGGVGIHYVIN